MTPDSPVPSNLDHVEQAKRALHARISAVYEVLFFSHTMSSLPGAPDERAAEQLVRVIALARTGQTKSVLWLLLSALSTVVPNSKSMREAISALARVSEGEFYTWLLATTAETCRADGLPLARVEILNESVVLDVTNCAVSDRQTGIQRVVRETVPIWAREHGVTLLRWSDGAHRMQRLESEEEDRVLRWGTRTGAQTKTSSPKIASRAVGPSTFVIPWASRLVLVEVTSKPQSLRLESLAEFSANSLSAIGYDCIPLVSPDLMPRPGGLDFMNYLQVMRRVDVIAGISVAAAQEFRGFLEATAAHGVQVADVIECELPADAPTDTPRRRASRQRPVILSVGSHEPRKNHLAVLYAAERMWARGLDFEMWFLGGHGWGTAFDKQVSDLQRKGRRIVTKRQVSDLEIWDAYAQCRFTVFPSLHEGYGLPVAESIALRKPVVTSNYGSTKQIAQRGGALLVDPRDDEDLYQAMHALLTDNELYAGLVEEATAAPVRSWTDYARELWSGLALPEGER
ncbi:glycosyltransferase [Salinibacterium sp. ZJ450]|uniref:glycosyltransferase n=1 Tax=Salinibacterium sp. ZJ450 TaxID=2708338 RepID=UPI00142046B2|nr:glycosyltransferase [Salinibacterium sp. ZJ450]